MNFRTDIALEAAHAVGAGEKDGVLEERSEEGGTVVTTVRIVNEAGEKMVGKPQGTYITIELPSFSEMGAEVDERLNVLSGHLAGLLPASGPVLVVGIGNASATPDALGPATAARIFATRHLRGELARSAGLDGLRPVAALSPGVLGQTGIETGEVIAAAVHEIEPAAVIAVDALASGSLTRLGCTVQMSDAGIVPGSGVGNRRAELSEGTLGIPVIALGVPTVVDAVSLAGELTGEKPDEQMLERLSPRGRAMMVTPREIDLLIERAAFLCALAINRALQPTLSAQQILSLLA